MTILLRAGTSFPSLIIDGYMPIQFAIITAIQIHLESDLSSILNL